MAKDHKEATLEILNALKEAADKERVGKSAKVKISLNKYEDEMKDKIILAASNSKMSYADLLAYLENEIEQSKKMTSFSYTIPCFKSDGAYALHRAIEEVFGVANSRGAEKPSGGGEENIKTIDISLADGTRLKVPYGEISLAGLGEGASIKIAYNNDNHLLLVNGTCQFKFASLIDDIVDRAKEILATDSIYKNQAIEITNLNDPKIMDLSQIDKQLLVLSESAQFALNPLKSRLLHPEKCIQKKVPLKYGCLLEGPYGTGKTLLAFKLAKDAISNGWIFVYLKSPALLAKTLKLIQTIDKSGHGAIVFVEDIDQVTRGERDNAMQEILNTLDGGDTKDTNIISLFTTNHIELIEPTFLRGKRIGSVISLGYLDEVTTEKFIRASFKDSGYKLEDDITPICKLIASSNIVPAFMAEICESVKSNLIMNEETFVKNDYIRWSVESYISQVELSRKKDMSYTPEMKLAQALKDVLKVDKILQSSLITSFERVSCSDSEEIKTYIEHSNNIVSNKTNLEDVIEKYY